MRRHPTCGRVTHHQVKEKKPGYLGNLTLQMQSMTEYYGWDYLI